MLCYEIGTLYFTIKPTQLYSCFTIKMSFLPNEMIVSLLNILSLCKVRINMCFEFDIPQKSVLLTTLPNLND